MNTIKVRDIIIGSGRTKICTSLIGKNKVEILEECNRISSMSVDLIEWRADFFKGILDFDQVYDLLKELRKILKKKPLIFTIRSKGEGGEMEISEDDYINLYEKICKLNLVDVIDIEYKISENNINRIVSLAHNCNIKVIISKHDFEKTPPRDEMIKNLVKMQHLNCDIAKLAVMPKNKLDVIKLLETTVIMNEKYNKTPIITISMGREGMISRISGEIFGSCITFASLEKASAPGQIEINDLNTSLNILHKNNIDKSNNAFNKINIMLIGFMGTGKSYISSRLSQLLNMDMIDTDSYIESKEHTTVGKIFSMYGEEYFRQCEKNALIDISNKKNTVVSCGGGIILKEENIKLMRKQGKIILLTASPEIIYERVKNSNERPILNNNMNIEFISNLLDQRKEKYLKAADIIIDTNNKDIENICNEIIKKL